MTLILPSRGSSSLLGISSGECSGSMILKVGSKSALLGITNCSN
jgi:hypothetical protein